MISRGILIGSFGFGMVFGGVMAAAIATGTEQRDSSKAEVGSCASYSGLPTGEGDTAGMVFIPGGKYKMGSERHQPEERVVHTVRVDGFWIDRHEVTNAQFRQFVDATGYRTLAERGLDPKTHPGTPKDLLVPGSVVFIAPTEITRGGSITQWWQYVAGANWRQPTGPGSTIAGKEKHPVVHIAYEDALAYAHWRGRELPTRRSGSSPRVAAATVRTIIRALTILTASRSQIPGRVSSRCSTPMKTGIPARRRSDASSRMATGFTI